LKTKKKQKMWSVKPVFASCFELNFFEKPDITVSRIDEECKKCVTLRARLKTLHEGARIGKVFVDDADSDEDKSEEEEEEEEVACHQIWLTADPHTSFSGAEQFPMTTRKAKFVHPTPLPHQTRFKHRYSPRDWDLKHPAVQMVWSLGSGKTRGVLDMLFTNSGPPPRSVFIVCPKSLLGMWTKAVSQYTSFPHHTKCRVVVCGFSYFNMLVSSSETPYTVSEVQRSCVIVDENQAYRNLTERQQKDLEVLQQVNNLFMLSGTPITKVEDVPALSMCLSVATPEDQSPAELSKWVATLRENNQIDYYNPEIMQPSFHKDHFPHVVRATVTVPMSWSQTWATLMCQRKLLHSPSGTVIGNAKTDSYAVLSRGFANSVSLRDGTVISPKNEVLVNTVLEGTESGKEARHAVTSEYLENGIFPVSAALRRHKAVKGVEQIDGNATAQARTKAVDNYNSEKSAVLCFSTCGRDGLDLRATDVFHAYDVHRNEILEGQAFGRVIRFGSHPRGGKVRVVRYVSSLPQDMPLKGSKDWQGLMEVFREFYAPAQYTATDRGNVLDRSRRERGRARAIGAKQAAAEFRKQEQEQAEFWERDHEHVETVINDIRKSLEHFGVTESIEQQILRTRREAAEAVQPFVDALVVAGVQQDSVLFKKYATKLNLKLATTALGAKKEEQKLSPDLKTFMRVSEDVCQQVHDFVIKHCQ